MTVVFPPRFGTLYCDSGTFLVVGVRDLGEMVGARMGHIVILAVRGDDEIDERVAIRLAGGVAGRLYWWSQA